MGRSPLPVRQIMIALIGMGLSSLIYSAVGFAPRFVPATRMCTMCRSDSIRTRSGPVSRDNRARWKQTSRTRTRMDGASGDGEVLEVVSTTTPRLKRVRKRRKDAVPATTKSEVEDNNVSEADLRPAGEQQSPIPTYRGQMAEVAEEVLAAPQQMLQRGAEEARRMAPVRTKGTKVRIDLEEDDISEKLAGAASAATGAAGEAASAVTGAAKSAIGAAISALGQEGQIERNFNVADVPKAGEAQQPKRSVDMVDLGADIERFRSRERGQQRSGDTGNNSLASGAKDLISNIITLDFFVVIAFMLWFIAGVVSSYGLKNDFLLDQFNDKWTPVVQPALGVLMGGTIAGGVVSKLGESEDENERHVRGARLSGSASSSSNEDEASTDVEAV